MKDQLIALLAALALVFLILWATHVLIGVLYV